MLVYLRPYRRFWTVLAGADLAVALTGVTAAILFALGRHAKPSLLATLAALAVLRILVAPLLAMASFVCGVLSPHRAPRLACFAATLVEVAVSAYGGVVWFVPLLFHKP
jgi:hypothetical protein